MQRFYNRSLKIILIDVCILECYLRINQIKRFVRFILDIRLKFKKY